MYLIIETDHYKSAPHYDVVDKAKTYKRAVEKMHGHKWVREREVHDECLDELPGYIPRTYSIVPFESEEAHA